MCCLREFHFFTFLYVIWNDQMIGRECSSPGGITNLYNILVGKSQYSRPQWPRRLSHGFAALGCWNCGFEFRWTHGCQSVENVVLLSGTGLCDGPLLRPEESYRVCVHAWLSLGVIMCNNKPLPLQCVIRRSQTKKKEEILRRGSHLWDNDWRVTNIKMDCYEEMRCEFVNWFQLASDRLSCGL